MKRTWAKQIDADGVRWWVATEGMIAIALDEATADFIVDACNAQEAWNAQSTLVKVTHMGKPLYPPEVR